MSAAEIGWRLQGGARDLVDRMRFRGNGRADRLAESLLAAGPARYRTRCSLPTIAPGAWAGEQADGPAAWRKRLLPRADMLRQNRLSFFDQPDCALGDPIVWNQDPKTGKRTPTGFAASIDYRDVNVAGDCKFVWEPARHHQLVVLGRAYRATGDTAYATAVAEQLGSWIDQCPFGTGMHWRSPLELGVRLINWVWALELIKDAGTLDGELHDRILRSAVLQTWDVARKFSRASSANNHLIGEAAGVWVASSYFSGFTHGERWRELSRNILCDEIIRQTHPDGGTREQALGYQLFVVQFFLISGLVARITGDDFPKAYWQRLEMMLDFLASLLEGGDRLPLYGDCDDGYVLDTDADPRDPRPWLGCAAVLFDRPDWAAIAGEFPEAGAWLLPPDARTTFEALRARPVEPTLQSRAFPDSGIFVLQMGTRGADDRISLVFDCGALGFGPIAAHGHADALSFSLRAFGVDVFVDPGTYDYFSHRAWRDYFRSTRAHNTVEIDGKDQSEMLGLFLWGARADSRCLAWSADAGQAHIAAEHDGYRRLDDPVHHKRSITLDERGRKLIIADELRAKNEHDGVIYFHVAEGCCVEARGENTFGIDTGRGLLSLELDRRLDVTVVRGASQPIAGWVSRGYHRKVASNTIAGRFRFSGGLSLNCEIGVGEASGARCAPALDGSTEGDFGAPGEELTPCRA